MSGRANPAVTEQTVPVPPEPQQRWCQQQYRHPSCFGARKPMKVRLIRKLADQLDGVNVSQQRVGDVLDLRPEQARVLVAEGWATSNERRQTSAARSFGDRRRVHSP